MTFYAGQKGPFFWFVFFGPAKKMNKMVNQQKYMRQKPVGLMNRIGNKTPVKVNKTPVNVNKASVKVNKASVKVNKASVD
ncbi:MAG: hypothetical protein CFE24_10040 [Flavobacterium sp. BFFFF2]|nr:MAG: hypothetical protein CFE24_10040 [Flavobacterium sp. BFFFF2]